MMRVLDLFSGIGGFSLGLERAGMTTVAFCEIDPYCQRVLAKHWPGVPIYDDIQELTDDTLRRDGIAVDVICGGFPCQDISVAGKGAGLEGARSGLWHEYGRIIRELQPQWVVIENVPAILTRGATSVTNQLAALGYDCMWECIPACAVGAPHRRDRWWCIAYAAGSRCQQSGLHVAGDKTAAREGANDQSRDDRAALPDAKRDTLRQQSGRRCGQDGAGTAFPAIDGETQPVADPDGCRRQAWDGNLSTTRYGHPFASSSGDVLCDADRQSLAVGQSVGCDDVEKFAPTIGADWWAIEPDVGRVAHGVPKRVDRLKGLGNAVVPQIPELIGRAIMAAR